MGDEPLDPMAPTNAISSQALSHQDSGRGPCSFPSSSNREPRPLTTWAVTNPQCPTRNIQYPRKNVTTVWLQNCPISPGRIPRRHSRAGGNPSTAPGLPLPDRGIRGQASRERRVSSRAKPDLRPPDFILGDSLLDIGYSSFPFPSPLERLYAAPLLVLCLKPLDAWVVRQ